MTRGPGKAVQNTALMSTDAEPPGQMPCILRAAETIACVYVRLGRRKTITGISEDASPSTTIGSYAERFCLRPTVATDLLVLEAEDVVHVHVIAACTPATAWARRRRRGNSEVPRS